MRILYLSISPPDDFSSGGNQRSNHIRASLMAFADVDTFVLQQIGTTGISADADRGNVVSIVISASDGMWRKARYRFRAMRMIAAADRVNGYDFIVARYFRNAMLVPPSAYRKLVVDGDDLRQSGVNRSVSRRVFVRIRAAVIRFVTRRMFHVWLVDPRDLVAVPGARISMLPNTARQAALTALPSAKVGRRILMVGMYAYPPNEEGLVWFARRILPRIADLFPNVEFHAIGQYYKQELDELGGAVTMRGFVDNLGEEYRQADVVICPIMSGSGTQIKVVEALMNGRPAVVSDFSYQGFSNVLTPDDHLLVARNEEEWVRHITAVLREPSRFTAMATMGCEVAGQAYSLEAFSTRVEDTFR